MPAFQVCAVTIAVMYRQDWYLSIIRDDTRQQAREDQIH